jgi:hypothetical protein
MLIAAFSPQSAYVSNMRHLLLLLYGAGIVMTVMALFVDYTRSYGPDYGAMILRATQIYILVMLTKAALVRSKGEAGA